MFINVTDGPDLTLHEVNEAATLIEEAGKVVRMGTIVDDELDAPARQRKRQAEASAAATSAAAATESDDRYDIPAFLRKHAN